MAATIVVFPVIFQVAIPSCLAAVCAITYQNDKDGQSVATLCSGFEGGANINPAFKSGTISSVVEQTQSRPGGASRRTAQRAYSPERPRQYFHIHTTHPRTIS
jgi:hypothetical protein